MLARYSEKFSRDRIVSAEYLRCTQSNIASAINRFSLLSHFHRRVVTQL